MRKTKVCALCALAQRPHKGHRKRFTKRETAKFFRKGIVMRAGMTITQQIDCWTRDWNKNGDFYKELNPFFSLERWIGFHIERRRPPRVPQGAKR